MEPELVEKMEAEAEEIYSRKASISVTETAEIGGTIAEWFEPAAAGASRSSGAGVVKGLKGTGDKGEAYNRAIEIFVEVAESANEMPLESTIAAVIVESEGGDEARVMPMSKTSVLDGGELIMTYLRDGNGEVRSAAFGPVKKASGGSYTARAVPKQAGGGGVILKPRYPWPDPGDSARAAVSAHPSYKANFEPDGLLRVSCGKEATVETVMKDIGKLEFKGTVKNARILTDMKAGAVTIFGKGVVFDKCNIRLGNDIRVVSAGPKEDFAIVEIAKEGMIARVRTTRKAADVIRILDRLGVDLKEIAQILKWASDSGVLNAGLLTAETGNVG